MTRCVCVCVSAVSCMPACHGAAIMADIPLVGYSGKVGVLILVSVPHEAHTVDGLVH